MSQEGAKGKSKLVQKEWTLEKQSLEAEAILPEIKGGPFFSSVSNPELLLVHFQAK